MTGRVALVTGAAGGLGSCLVSLLAAEGATVVSTDVRDEAGEGYATSLRERGRRVRYAHLDVRNADEWEGTMRQIEAEDDRLDILVNNAGIVSTADADREIEGRWGEVIAVNQTGVFLGLRETVPAMAAGGGGAIVNVASNLGLVGTSGYFAYQASKAAVVQMTRAAAVAHAGDGIRVNAVCPGLIETAMLEDEEEPTVDAFRQTTPLGRGAEPVEVAQAILFLASDEASYITGATLVVDGGYAAGR